MTAVLEIAGLRKTFRTLRGGPRRALDGFDMVVEEGQVHGFLGPNGSGKTTTLRTLLGLVGADGGTMRLFGQPVPQALPHVVYRFGAIVESPQFFGNFSGRRTLTLLATAGGVPHRRVDEVLELVGMRDRAGDRVRTYSLGMQQRLAVASALLKSPELLILDEPANGLDPAGIREMRDLMRDLAAAGATVLVSSHLLDEVEQICDSVTIISRGRRVAAGPVADVLAVQDRGEYRVRVAEPARAAGPGRANVEAGPTARLDGDHIDRQRCLRRRLDHRDARRPRALGQELTPLAPDLEDVFLTLTGTMPEPGLHRQVDDSVQPALDSAGMEPTVAAGAWRGRRSGHEPGTGGVDPLFRPAVRPRHGRDPAGPAGSDRLRVRREHPTDRRRRPGARRASRPWPRSRRCGRPMEQEYQRCLDRDRRPIRTGSRPASLRGDAAQGLEADPENGLRATCRTSSGSCPSPTGCCTSPRRSCASSASSWAHRSSARSGPPAASPTSAVAAPPDPGVAHQAGHGPRRRARRRRRVPGGLDRDTVDDRGDAGVIGEPRRGSGGRSGSRRPYARADARGGGGRFRARLAGPAHGYGSGRGHRVRRHLGARHKDRLRAVGITFPERFPLLHVRRRVDDEEIHALRLRRVPVRLRRVQPERYIIGWSTSASVLGDWWLLFGGLALVAFRRRDVA